MDDIFYVKKFIRDDGESLALDKNELYLSDDNEFLIRPDPETTAINYTEANGAEMVKQQNHAFAQEINGLIVPKATPYWNIVTQLTAFFKINHTYKIIYARKSGKLFAIDGAWISEALQVPPRPQEDYTKWHITFEVGKEEWREYAEDDGGKEIYANTVELPLITGAAGGEKWDNVGLVFDDVGAVWESGEGGIQEVNVSSSATVYPLWTVVGECVNPILQNNTTDEVASYNGTIAEGQILTVNFETGVAYLDGALVTRNVSGIVSCRPGLNIMGFNSDGGTTEKSTVSWNNAIG